MTLRYKRYYDYLAKNVITPFYHVRLEGLQSLKLVTVLRRKNPYLFKAKNIEVAGDLVKSIVDAHLSSREETIFGNFLEGFALYVTETLYGGFKSKLKSVDLEFERDGAYYIVGIKSGTSWGNKDQKDRMLDNFKVAKQFLRERGHNEVIAVNGCIYGKDRHPFKAHTDPDKQYYKFAGQEFWHFISNDDDLYRKMIEPIDKEAQHKDETFKRAYAAKVNEMTQDFISNFMTTDNQINWIKLVDFVSKKE